MTDAKDVEQSYSVGLRTWSKISLQKRSRRRSQPKIVIRSTSPRVIFWSRRS